MRPFLSRSFRSSLILVVAACCLSRVSAADPHSKAFLAENEEAMKKMMKDMDIKPTGDIDKDFAAMMIPHHQGAIDMAEAELRYGHNEPLRRIAQEIIVEQQQEIAAMQLAFGAAPSAAPSERDGATAPSPSDPSAQTQGKH